VAKPFSFFVKQRFLFDVCRGQTLHKKIFFPIPFAWFNEKLVRRNRVTIRLLCFTFMKKEVHQMSMKSKCNVFFPLKKTFVLVRHQQVVADVWSSNNALLCPQNKIT